uniref:Uncharacterized protein n=1 Tax=Timema monikensis TaxID=170555 RepID=A0A7R9HRF0_9NEOP|nr:unnamed protein product [Timema monikensis]
MGRSGFDPEMADDPNRDLLPVKEGADCNNPPTSTCSLGDIKNVALLRKRSKYELEDQYLRYCQENKQLKVLCNTQEDKIKSTCLRLALVVPLDEALKRKTLLWLGHVMIMEKDGIPKKALQNKEKGRRHIGRPWTSWIYHAQDMEVKGIDWRRVAEGEV